MHSFVWKIEREWVSKESNFYRNSHTHAYVTKIDDLKLESEVNIETTKREEKEKEEIEMVKIQINRFWKHINS